MTTARHERHDRRFRRTPKIESLELRQFLSGNPLADVPGYIGGPVAMEGTTLAAQTDAVIGANTPQWTRHAYGLDRLAFNGQQLDGSRQTIAIVALYDDPNIASDLHEFDSYFNLPDPSFAKFQQAGPGNAPLAGSTQYGVETSLDVEWAHAMAPGANIALVEGNPDDYTQYGQEAGAAAYFDAVNWVRQQQGVSVVSMSYGWTTSELVQSGFGLPDGVFTTPQNHQGVTFIAASGDRDSGHGYYPQDQTGRYPALSPNVVGVGATILTTDTNANWLGEYADPISGGGGNPYSSGTPNYQSENGVDYNYANSPTRASPDVAWNDGNVTICDTFGEKGLFTMPVGGTSAAAPQFAGMTAVADQGRVLAGEGTLDGPSQTLPLLYELQSSFHDITQIANLSDGSPAFRAGQGYDLVSGLGTPIADILVPQLVEGGFLSLNAQGGTFSVAGNTDFSNQEVAIFSDPNGYLGLACYSATIDWGDGAQSSGTIALDGNNYLGVFGSHSYSQSGDYTVTVTIHSNRFHAPAATQVTSSAQVSAPTQPTGGSGQAGSGNTDGNSGSANSGSPSSVGSETPNEIYVTDVFEAVLGRAPTADELTSWAGQLDHGLARDSFVNALDHSDEYYATIIRPAFEAYLGREADSQGLAYWISQMQAGLTDEQLEARFIASDEFYRNAGGTDQGWVDSLYEHLLGRGADAQGEAYWLTQLAGGEQRFDVAFGFTGGLERESKRIQSDYQHYLDRPADPQGVDYWVNQFAQGQTNENLITGFLASDEYYQTHSS